MRSGRRVGAGLCWGSALGMSIAPAAQAYDAGKLAGKPLTIDVTETSIFSQRFDARRPLPVRDHGWGQWVNRLNVQATNGPWTAGLRLDAAVYWSRPADRDFCAGCLFDSKLKTPIVADGQSRFLDNVYPAKLWASYKKDSWEVTAGDAYVQFGRGLTLSMRKLDELGVDTSVRGLKLSYRNDPIAVVLVAGMANPTRVDEASGRSLMLTKPAGANTGPSAPVFGADRIFGAEVTAGRGTALVSGTRVASVYRCAPFAYDAAGAVRAGAFDTPFGTCDAADAERYLSGTLSGSPNAEARQTLNIGQSLELTRLGEWGRAYMEVALQSRQQERRDRDSDGSALYATANARFGKTSHTVELKSYRNYYPLMAAVSSRYAPELASVTYSQLPTAEPITADSMFGNFNACATGVRYRSDVNATDRLLVYGAAAYTRTTSEQPGTGCDRSGSVRGSIEGERAANHVWDFTLGTEYRWNTDRSHVYAWVNVRDDHRGDGTVYYTEKALLYTVNVHLSGNYALEMNGRHRLRFQDDENLQDVSGEVVPEPWRQGFHYTALKIAPKWSISQGVEYLTLAGQPEWYLNGGALYRLDEKSNVRVFAGQQQGGLRCLNGICRTVPAYEGVRVELALRF